MRKQTSISDIMSASPRSRSRRAQQRLRPGGSTRNIITKERRGDFLGATVQVVPHVTDEIKSYIRRLSSGHDVVITENRRHGPVISSLCLSSRPFASFRQDVGRKKHAFSFTSPSCRISRRRES